MSVWLTSTTQTATSCKHSSGNGKSEAAQAFKGEIVGQRRLASSGEMAPAKRFESITMTRDTTGTLEAMPHWAGESVASVEKVQPAALIIDELMSEAERLLHNWK